MNNCILMAEIIQDPQLRYTSDNQTPLAEMVIQFSGLRAEDPLATMKAVGWGNLAQEIQQRYRQGDRVVIEGRLNMNTVDRPEGFKEKRAELTIQRIHSIVLDASVSSTARETTGHYSNQPSATVSGEPVAVPAPRSTQPKAPPVTSEPDYDEIPF